MTQYLIDNGIKNDLITTRYHGERYPAVSNSTKESRARNRRTTVRLERGPRVPRKPKVEAEDSEVLDDMRGS